jgi:hypothetical protein
MEAELEILDAADPFGAVDHAALCRRDDFAAGHVHDRESQLLPDLAGDAGLPALHAFHVGDGLDRLLEPAKRLGSGW